MNLKKRMTTRYKIVRVVFAQLLASTFKTSWESAEIMGERFWRITLECGHQRNYRCRLSPPQFRDKTGGLNVERPPAEMPCLDCEITTLEKLSQLHQTARECERLKNDWIDWGLPRKVVGGGVTRG